MTSETELDELCYDCDGEVQILRKDCPKCKQERDERVSDTSIRNNEPM